MAIFTESVCLNWFNESSLKFANSKTSITWDKSIEDKDQVVKNIKCSLE